MYLLNIHDRDISTINHVEKVIKSRQTSVNLLLLLFDTEHYVSICNATFTTQLIYLLKYAHHMAWQVSTAFHYKLLLEMNAF